MNPFCAYDLEHKEIFRNERKVLYPWNEDELQKKFHGSPLLSISNVEVLTFRRSQKKSQKEAYVPRKYSPVWYLHPCLSPGQYVGPMWVPPEFATRSLDTPNTLRDGYRKYKSINNVMEYVQVSSPAFLYCSS